MKCDLSQTKDALTEAKTRVTAAEASVKFLDTSLAKHKVDVFTLTTALAASKDQVAELEREVTPTFTNLTMARNVAQEESTNVLDLDSEVKTLTRKVDDVVGTAVASVNQRVDRFHNSTNGAPQPNPRGANIHGSSGTGPGVGGTGVGGGNGGGGTASCSAP